MNRYLLAAGVVAILSTSAMATLFFEENFDSYTQGNLAGQGGWTAHSGAGANPVQVVASTTATGNAAKLVNAAASSEDVNTPTGVTQGATDKWYASFLVSVTGTVTGSDYFAHFKNVSNVFPTKIGVTPFSGSDYTFYVWQGSGSGPTGTGAGAIWGTGFTFGTVHRIVASYENATGQGELWVDPDPALGEDGNTKLSVTNGPSANANAVAYALRQGSLGATSGLLAGTQEVDNLRVGTSFAEVIPEPATLILLALGGLAALRRRGA
ncbi:MAG TPA: PEP-CTERM sorting domain-containing protein [Phycisphaerae bacterium]|nr:PEP-CTERM sorting domain-containing protein [Phycisphaerae bacterium]HRY67386.1 PEP-CTERM sorting domain-containing protein [Phycisphaerae bacterium]HSA29322.1 PEP-CTERM sorting domain-containing protein [Phycisphaerae bacterium]